MKALLCSKIGDLNDLEVGEIPAPDLSDDGVRIAVRAAALNFPDLLSVRGQYQHHPSLPFVPGLECAGEVLEVGKDVTDFTPGDRVMARSGLGSLAEQVCAGANNVFHLPDELSLVDAAGFIITYGTSYHAFVHRGSLKAGETVLVLGAAGGVGLTAVELAKRMQARVIAAASSEEKLNLCREYGADECIDYTTESIKDRVMDITDGKGIDIAYDPVGGDAMFQALRCMAIGGRLLIVGFASGTIADIPANRLLLRQSQAVGIAHGSWCNDHPREHRDMMAILIEWWRQGKLKPHVSRTYPLRDGIAAMKTLAERKALGKVVLTFDP
jgi:NADPH2:quinone reductase